LDGDSTWREGLEQHINAPFWASCSAHENIQRRILQLRPCVDRDMTLSEHGNPTDSTVRLERMKVDVQESCACDFDAFSQGALHERLIIKSIRIVQVDNQMSARTAHSRSLDKEVLVGGLRNSLLDALDAFLPQ
jgi:hypothetical protein